MEKLIVAHTLKALSSSSAFVPLASRLSVLVDYLSYFFWGL